MIRPLCGKHPAGCGRLKMVATLYCEVLARVGAPQEVTAPATNALGDWYACPLALGHQRFVLLISEHARLPVLMGGRDLKHLGDNFPDALMKVLWGLGIDAAVIQREVEAIS